ncbi:Sea24, partial [Klebsiella pneumoniae hvKP1]
AQDRDLMLVTMTDKELSRINIIQSVIEKRMRRRDAAHQLALTECQTQRLIDDQHYSESIKRSFYGD